MGYQNWLISCRQLFVKTRPFSEQESFTFLLNQGVFISRKRKIRKANFKSYLSMAGGLVSLLWLGIMLSNLDASYGKFDSNLAGSEGNNFACFSQN